MMLNIFGRRELNNEFGVWYSASLQPLFTPDVHFFGMLRHYSWVFSTCFVGGLILGAIGHSFMMMIAWLVALCLFGFLVRKAVLARKPKFRPIQKDLVIYKDDNGLVQVSDGGLESEAVIYYAEYPRQVDVRYFKTGDRYQAGADKQGELLEAVLGMELVRQSDGVTKGEGGKKPMQYVQYTFNKQRGEHEVVSALPVEDDAMKFDVSRGFTVDLRKNYSQLVSGASGAGKSYYTYYYLTRFISQTVTSDGIARHAELFAIDPKMSDLYKLCQVTGMPREHYGSTNAEAFAIAKRFRAEVDRRKEIYNKSTAFDTVVADLGLPPLLLVIEEFSSLITSMDKKQRADFEAMLMQIVQMGRQLSMGLLIVMQSPKSEDLNTSIRANLATAVHLGVPTPQVAQMMFGTSDLPAIGSEKGAGLVSLEKGAPIKFRAPEFGGDVFSTIMPVWEAVAKTYEGSAVSDDDNPATSTKDWEELL